MFGSAGNGDTGHTANVDWRRNWNCYWQRYSNDRYLRRLGLSNGRCVDGYTRWRNAALITNSYLESPLELAPNLHELGEISSPFDCLPYGGRPVETYFYEKYRYEEYRYIGGYDNKHAVYNK